MGAWSDVKVGAGTYPVSGVGYGTACRCDSEWGSGQRAKAGEEVVEEVTLVNLQGVYLAKKVD